MKDLAERNRQTLSIEQLLIWAYRDQRVHQARRGPAEIHNSSGPLSAYSKLWQDTAPVEASRNMGFEAAEDAWRIHDVVMGLGRYQVDCGPDLRAARYHALGTYRAAEPPIDGGSVDQMARPWPTDGQLQIDLRALVIIHATSATRPPPPGKEPVRFKPGGTVWHKKRTGAYHKGWFCHITADGDLPGDQLKDWETYSAWRGALVRLQAALQAIRLTQFNVSAALPPPIKKPGRGLV